MNRLATGFIACALLWGTAAAPAADSAAALKVGLFLYAVPGLPDPNFAKTVVLLVEHGAEGSLGLVVNRPTSIGVDTLLDQKGRTGGRDVPVYWGGPVQPDAVLALVRSPRPGFGGRTVVTGVQLARNRADLDTVLAEPNAVLKVRVFAGYAGWNKGQLAAEVRHGSWVLDRADAASIFSPEPSRLWERVHEIRGRLQAWSLAPPHADADLLTPSLP